MKNHTEATQHTSLNLILKFLGQVFNSLFQSPDHREFKRLKDFIAS